MRLLYTFTRSLLIITLLSIATGCDNSEGFSENDVAFIKQFGGRGTEVARDLVNFGNGVLIVGGTKSIDVIGSSNDSLTDDNFDMLFLRVDENGQEIALNTFGTEERDEIATSVLRISDGFIVTGYSTAIGSNPRKELEIASDLQDIIADSTVMFVLWLNESLEITRSRSYSLQGNVSTTSGLDTFSIAVPNNIAVFQQDKFIITGSGGVAVPLGETPSKLSQIFYITIDQAGNPLRITNFGEDVQGSRFARGLHILNDEYPIVLSARQRDIEVNNFSTRLTLLNPNLNIPIIDNQLNQRLENNSPTTTNALVIDQNNLFVVGSVYSNSNGALFQDQSAFVSRYQLLPDQDAFSNFSGGIRYNNELVPNGNSEFFDGTVVNNTFYLIGTYEPNEERKSIFLTSFPLSQFQANQTVAVNSVTDYFDATDASTVPIKMIRSSDDQLVILAETDLGDTQVITLIKSGTNLQEN